MDSRMQQQLSPRMRLSSSSTASTRSTAFSTDASAVHSSSSNSRSSNSSVRINSSSSGVGNGSLATLKPVDMQPDRYTDGMAAVAFLRKIDSIRIERFAKRHGVLYYVVDVYLKRPESRIPTNVRDNQQRDSVAAAAPAMMSASTKKKSRTPDFQVEHRFSEFTKLRSRAYHVAQSSHGIMRCALCDDVVTATLLGDSQPKRYMNFLCSRAVLAAILADFLNSSVEIALRHRRVHGLRACDAQEQIPLMLRGFLQPERESGSS